MKQILISVLFASLCALSASTTAAEKVVRVYLDKGDVHPILNVSANSASGHNTEIQAADCPRFDSEVFRGAFRFEVELALICNVLHAAGLADTLRFFPYPNTRRALVNLGNGQADLIGETLFQSALPSELISTDALIELGDFQVGVFTSPNRSDVLGIKSADDFRDLRGITVEHWPIDLKTLRGMGLKSVVTTSVGSLIPDMIAANRADFMLTYLDREETTHLGDRLVRIDGFRVSFDGIRVLAVAPGRQDIADAINAFVRKSRAADTDRVREAYKLSGFIIDKYSGWTDVTKP